MLCCCHVFACLYTMAFFMAYQARRVFGFGLSSLRLVLLDCFIFRLSNNGLQTVDLVLGPSLWIFCRRGFKLCSFHPSLHLLFTPNCIFGSFCHEINARVVAFTFSLSWSIPSEPTMYSSGPMTTISCKLCHFPPHRIVSQLVCHWNTKHWFRARQMLRHFQRCFF